MEKTYRILSKIEDPLKSHSDFVSPKATYTLIQEDNQRIRTILERRHDWEVGNAVKIEEDLVRANLVG